MCKSSVIVRCCKCGIRKPQSEFKTWIYDMVDPEDAVCTPCKEKEATKSTARVR